MKRTMGLGWGQSGRDSGSHCWQSRRKGASRTCLVDRFTCPVSLGSQKGSHKKSAGCKVKAFRAIRSFLAKETHHHRSVRRPVADAQ